VEAARNRGQSLSEPRSRVTTSYARRDPYRSCNGESVCLGFNLFAMYVRVLKNCKLWTRKCHLFGHANCESHTYARWERKPIHWKEIFSWDKTAETRNSPLPYSAGWECSDLYLHAPVCSHGGEFKCRDKFTTAAAYLLATKDWRSDISHIRESVLSRVNLEGEISACVWPSVVSEVGVSRCLGCSAPLSNFYIPLSNKHRQMHSYIIKSQLY